MQLTENIEKTVDRRFSIAPMMDWSDRHCRMFWRSLTRNALLYTEMVTTGALLHGDAARWLAFDEREQPLALQLGGSDPQALAKCARLAQQWGYDEVNLNCGCPSDRVQTGAFGACLMREPARVADCLKAMQDACSLPITVKHRIGVDTYDRYEDMVAFVEPLHAAGCNTFIVHARKAWLQGLSPKENRELPPLHYDFVYRLKREYPTLEIIINGGIHTLDEAETHLQQVDGVMLGRAAYHDPYLLIDVDRRFFAASDTPPRSRRQVLLDYLPYIEKQLAAGVRLNHISRHILGLFHGQPGGRLFRRHLSEHAHRPGAGLDVLEAALEYTELSE